MTKRRAPLSLDAALARIAGQLPGGWPEMGKLVNRAETTVRKWGDEAQPEQLPMPAAIALDIAFQRAGGEGAPVFEAYALMLEVSRQEAFADQVALQRTGCEFLRESAEAVEAIVLAGMPGAGQRERDRAATEIEHVDQLIPRALAQLRAQPPPDTG